MNIDQILATIAALQEAGTDEAVIKKMILAMLAEEAGASVDMPAGDAPALASDPPADQGAAPITSQPMAARNPAPSRPQPQRPGAQPQRPAAQPQRPAAPAQPAASASYGNNQTKLQMLAGLIGHAFRVRDGEEAAPVATPTRPANYSNQPARPAQPQRPAPVQPVAYADAAPSTEEQLLENTLFTANERLGMHTGQSPEFLRKLLRQDPALYAEAIGGNEPITYQDGGASPAAVVGARPLANTGGPMAERNAMANKAFAYRDAEIKAGRPCTFDQALTKIIQQRGPAPQR